jgi:hypothetical protein
MLKNSNNQKDDIDLESLEFFNAFNIQDASLSSSFIDEQVINNEKIYSFKDDVTYFLKNSNNFTIILININSLNYKYSNIKFTLDEALADILIIPETKLGPSKCDSEFTHKDYNMLRRDRISTDKISCKNKKILNSKNSNNKLKDHNDSRGGGLIVFVKKPYSVFNLKIHKTLEAMNFSIRFGNKKYYLFTGL